MGKQSSMWLRTNGSSLVVSCELIVPLGQMQLGKVILTWRLGCIFKNKQGIIISQASRVGRNAPSPLIAEALALRWALLTALSLDYSKIYFNTDCQSLFAALTSTTSSAGLYGIMKDIDHLFSSFFFFFCQRIYFHLSVLSLLSSQLDFQILQQINWLNLHFLFSSLPFI